MFKCLLVFRFLVWFFININSRIEKWYYKLSNKSLGLTIKNFKNPKVNKKKFLIVFYQQSYELIKIKQIVLAVKIINLFPTFKTILIINLKQQFKEVN